METENSPKPMVSVITVNYNQSGVTLDLLGSLMKISYPNIEIIVVDNASPTDNPRVIEERFPGVKLIMSEKNLGFAGGNNIGIKAAKGDYFLFINNDIEVPPGFLEPLVETLQSDPTIGIISPKIKFHWAPDVIQYAGYTPMGPITFRQNLIGYRQVDMGQFDTPMPTYSIHGAAMMAPRKVVEEVGLMAEVYFLYYEEHDWCTRIKRAGYKAYYQPKSYVLHKESVSTGKESPLKIYYIARNRILYARRNSHGFIFIINFLYFNFISLPKSTLVYLVRWKFGLMKAVYRAMFWNLTHYKSIHTNIKLQEK